MSESKIFKRHSTAGNKSNKGYAMDRNNALQNSLQQSYHKNAITKNAGNIKEMWKEIKHFGHTLVSATLNLVKLMNLEHH